MSLFILNLKASLIFRNRSYNCCFLFCRFLFHHPIYQIQCRPGHPESRPLVHWNCSNSPVEADGEIVPVEHRPLESAAVTLDCNSRKRRKQREANATPARFRLYEKIFEKKSALSEERGIIVEEERKSSFFSIDTGDEYFSCRMFSEKRGAKLFPGGNAFVAKFFLFSETLNQLKNERKIIYDCGSHADCVVCGCHNVIIHLASATVNGILQCPT